MQLRYIHFATLACMINGKILIMIICLFLVKQTARHTENSLTLEARTGHF